MYVFDLFYLTIPCFLTRLTSIEDEFESALSKYTQTYSEADGNSITNRGILKQGEKSVCITDCFTTPSTCN